MLGPLHFYVNFRVSLSVSAEENLLGFWQVLFWIYRSIWENCHLPIHKHRLSLHLFWSSSLSAMFYSLGLCLTLLLLKLFLSILFFLLLWMELFSLEPVCLNIILYCWGERKSQGWFLRFPGWVVGGIVEPPFDKKNSGEGADLGFVRKWHVREVEFEE